MDKDKMEVKFNTYEYVEMKFSRKTLRISGIFDGTDLELNKELNKYMIENGNSILNNPKDSPNITTNNSGNNNLNEIKQLKELLDMGAITQEEFNIKKKQLLGI